MTRAEIENIGRIQLPPSASSIQARAGGFQDRYISIRFDMAPADLGDFLHATRYTPSIGPTAAISFQLSTASHNPSWSI